MNQDEPVPGGWTDPAVYLRDGVFVAEEYHGNNQLVCLVAGESDPTRLAETFNQDVEDRNMASKKKSKTATAATTKTKKPRAAKTPKTKAAKTPRARKPDLRLPGPGTILRKTYKGKEIEVRVNGPASFTYNGKQYESFGRVVQDITGWKTKKGENKGKVILPNPWRFFKKQLEEKMAEKKAS